MLSRKCFQCPIVSCLDPRIIQFVGRIVNGPAGFLQHLGVAVECGKVNTTELIHPSTKTVRVDTTVIIRSTPHASAWSHGATGSSITTARRTPITTARRTPLTTARRTPITTLPNKVCWLLVARVVMIVFFQPSLRSVDRLLRVRVPTLIKRCLGVFGLRYLLKNLRVPKRFEKRITHLTYPLRVRYRQP